jgi:hypothetical protein
MSATLGRLTPKTFLLYSTQVPRLETLLGYRNLLPHHYRRHRSTVVALSSAVVAPPPDSTSHRRTSPPQATAQRPTPPLTLTPPPRCCLTPQRPSLLPLTLLHASAHRRPRLCFPAPFTTADSASRCPCCSCCPELPLPRAPSVCSRTINQDDGLLFNTGNNI